MKIIKPPQEVKDYSDSLFLAGSIEMGKAMDWQKEIIDHLNTCEGIILNPRRDDWDSSWEQSITNIEFNRQVNWELDGIENASIVCFYFDPDTKAPITLLELGRCVSKSNIIVCCPDGYWRKGNVEIICERYNIKLVHTFDEFKNSLKMIFE